MLRHRHAPLLLAAAAAGATLLAESPSGDSGRSIASTLHHGLARSSRAVYTIGFVVADYKYSLRGLSTESADYREKLSEATPSSFQDIKLVLQKNFGRKINDIFLELDEHPIAAASIAQIFPDYRFDSILVEFERSMSMELDFTKEAKNSERTASCFRKNSVVKVPSVFWVDDLDFLRRENINPTKVAKALVELFGEMIFVHGFVHGDPHPGNILVSPQGHGNFSLVLGDNFSGLLRSILGNLEVPRHVRLLTYAKCAVDGLDKQSKMESGK
ncbi:hypothetical protein PR202_ga22213 [Eleusine coracana subsp. coracana]|uniref:ABC1 atypical kinase-like domain-containing protein n=1 Tax=Eleusine coracana subsp. coracana TaxID=191504 RepID=A0AAV5D121_ELECO|nr:hypothetical protein PR202_ga22213 [Eleusine coracana subsp. coracana]